jgi:phage repressor protein C with HTH and peptisase S24 domain
MVGDPDAFAVTLTGDSMESEFHEGDILVFAPSAEVEDGDACFVGFRTGEHTFKCVYDLGGGRLELRPLNTRKHRTQIVSTESGTGVARVVKLVGRYQIWNWKRRA